MLMNSQNPHISPKIFLDSCVILSQIPREMAFNLAKIGKCQLYYSQSVYEETAYVAARNGLSDFEAVLRELQKLGHRVLQEEIAHFQAEHVLWLKDENDIHVLEGAIVSKAQILLTENLRDFPQAVLSDFALKALTPDQFYFQYCEDDWILSQNYSTSALKRAKLYKIAKMVKSNYPR